MKKAPFLLAILIALLLVISSGTFLTINAAPEDGPNLALGKTATARSNTTGNAPGNAIDGNASSTRWVSSNSDPQWIRVDLGQAYMIGRVILDWHNSNYGTKYFIEVSNDDVNWTVVSDRFFVDLPVTDSTHRVDDIFFEPVEARYVRMYGLARSGSYSLWEFEIYGPNNTAAGKTATASSGNAAALTDGEAATTWNSTGKVDEWFGVDLGGVMKTGSVKINWGDNYATEYSIRVSDNGNDWYEAYSTTNGKGGLETINLAPLSPTRYAKQAGVDPQNIPTGQTPDGYLDVSIGSMSARYIRVYPLAGPGASFSVKELETYGNPWKSAPAISDNSAIAPKMYLSDGWMLARAPDVFGTPAAISSTGFDISDGNWIKAVVPGTVLTSYFKAGIIPDPYYSDNIYKLSQWYFNVDYWYRNEFTVPQGFEGNRVILNFESVNWLSDVYVNGQNVGSTFGPFKQEAFDVTEYLAYGKTNTIAVNIHIFQTTNQSGGKYDQLLSLPHFQSSGGWDWIPVIPGRNLGIVEPVLLTTRNTVSIKNQFIKTDLPNWTPPTPNTAQAPDTALPDLSQADVSVDVELENNGANDITGVVKGVINPGAITFQKTVNIPANRSVKVSFDPAEFAQLQINNPKLWWPNGYGDQFLYDIDLSYEIGGVVSDIKSLKFGIREFGYWWKDGTVNWVWIMGSTTNYNQDMNAWNLQFYCNGVKIMLKGGNWGMPDAMLAWGPEQYDTAIKLHAEENFTMIRAWCGTTDNESFYNACDKYGILVWTDFWIHGANMTAVTGPFLQNARAKVERVRNHPSLALYCGGNEWTPWGIFDNDPSGPNWAPGPNPSGLLPLLCAELDPTRLYITLSSGQPVRGGVTYQVEDPTWYFDRATRSPGFTTEIGTAVLPNYESMKEMMEEKYWWPARDSSRPFDKNINYMWQIHDLGGVDDIGNKGAEKMLNEIDKRYGESVGMEEFLIKAQMVNYETNRAMFEAWNNNLFNHTSGILLWMSQSAWPSTMWQTYDSYFDTNGAFFGAKKGSEPVHVQYDSNSRVVKVINNTALPLQNAKVKIDLYNLDGTLYRSYEDTITALPSVATQVRSVSGDLTGNSISTVHFIKLVLTDANGNVLSDNFYWDSRRTGSGNRTRYITYSGVDGLDKLPKVALDAAILESATENGITSIKVRLTNNTDSVAVMTRLKMMKGLTEERILPTYYDDNYFGMLPGETRIVNIEFEAKHAGIYEPVLRMEGYNTVSAVIDGAGSTPSTWDVYAKAQLSEDALRDSVDVMATVKNHTDEAGDVNVIVVSYDGAGRMLTMSMMEIAVPARSSKSTVWFSTMDIHGNADVCSVKVFAWDPLDFTPLCAAGLPVIMPAGTY
ncbi:MAG: discoidin domain-containing protein [Oscillospiraceae bacterium]|nr:discoidin domain-containing protein [Oscillospiraceae bacterium]